MQAEHATKLAPRIKLLDPLVSERIAAGEVLERPASAVKELVENAIDAGATGIDVRLEKGGKQLIEVTDNGCGMSEHDLVLSVRRHATSKLSTLGDLDRILTLGFRGEALPSIGAVSELSIVTRTKASNTAYEFICEQGKEAGDAKPLTYGHFLHSHSGTRVRATGLFSEVPARLKFLRSQSAELSQVKEWMEKISLAHPNIALSLSSDGKTLLDIDAQGELKRISSILCEGQDYQVVSAASESLISLKSLISTTSTGNPKLRAYWIQGLSLPHTRKLIQIVNGRVVKDKMLQQAVMGKFRQALLPGQFPAMALYVEIDPSQVDVNVHPAKTEIRFLNSSPVFTAVSALVASMLQKHGSPAVVPAVATDAPRKEPLSFFPEMPVGSSEKSQALAQTRNPRPSQPTFWQASETFGRDTEPGRFVGVLFDTYLVFEALNELVLIDQHAAHERVRYERLKNSSGKSISPQQLLIPEAVRFSSELRIYAEKRVSVLQDIGFEAELFGDDTILFRAVPIEWGLDNLRTRLKNLTEKLLSTRESGAELGFDEHLFEALASEACHGSVRAREKITEEEAKALAQSLFLCAHPWNCPHGRPTTVRVPISKVEEWFKRTL